MTEVKNPLFPRVKSVPTEQDDLVMAMSIVRNDCGYSDSDLESRYFLSRSVLRNIRNGVLPTRQTDKYFNAFVHAINDKRLRSLNKDKDIVKAGHLQFLLAELMLVHCGIAPDREMNEMQSDLERREYMKSIGWKRG